MTEDMAYYTERLQCSTEEKDACLETVAKLYRLQKQVRDNGILVAEVLAETEPDPFFQTGLMELAELSGEPSRLERLLTQYLMAGNYRGGAFLNAVLITQGLVLLSRYSGTDKDFYNRNWGELLCETLRGYFGAEYREKVIRAIKAAQPKREYPSLLPEFDGLLELSPVQRDWLVRQFPHRILCLALKVGGSEIREFLLEGAEDREALEQDLSHTYNVRTMDVEAAQREILEKAKEIPACM